MRIAIDVMGTDYGPEEIIAGSLQAVHAYNTDVVLVGAEEEIRTALKKLGESDNPHVSIKNATQVIEMKEHPAIAVKEKKDASVVVASTLLRKKDCDAIVSPGSTGAAVAAALFCIGRIHGVERPSIATPIPNKLKGTTVLMDSGAKVDTKPEQMVQSAIMGSVYAEMLLGKDKPTVGLLNIGEEENKGNEQTLATLPLMREAKEANLFNFFGNVEGRDITNGKVDVVVCDGFVGNVVLKTMEGLAKVIFELLRDAVMDGGCMAKLGALLLKPALKKLATRMDASEYGGALLLGIKAPFIICHGSSKAKDIKSAIGKAIYFAEHDIVGRVTEKIAESKKRKKADAI